MSDPFQINQKELENFACGMFRKELNGTYSFVNSALLRLHQLSLHQIIARKDKELPWSARAKELCLNDQKVLDLKKPMAFFETIIRRGQIIKGYCHKSPVFDKKNQLIGISGIFMELPSTENHQSLRLSVREKQCMNNLVKGLTAAESAKILGLSRRTVEGYLEELRQKYHCKNQAELVALYCGLRPRA